MIIPLASEIPNHYRSSPVFECPAHEVPLADGKEAAKRLE